MNKMINYLILVSYLLFYHILLLPTGYINIVSYLQYFIPYFQKTFSNFIYYFTYNFQKNLLS